MVKGVHYWRLMRTFGYASVRAGGERYWWHSILLKLAFTSFHERHRSVSTLPVLNNLFSLSTTPASEPISRGVPINESMELLPDTPYCLDTRY